MVMDSKTLIQVLRKCLESLKVKGIELEAERHVWSQKVLVLTLETHVKEFHLYTCFKDV